MSPTTPTTPLRPVKPLPTSAWWMLTLFFVRGLPYMFMLMLAPIIMNRMRLSNGTIAFYTSLAFLPFVLRPLWVRIMRSRLGCRRWMVLTQSLLALTFLGMAGVLQLSWWLPCFLLLLYLQAVLAAIYDIAVSRYMTLMTGSVVHGTLFGLRGAGLCLAVVFGFGLSMLLGGNLEVVYRNISFAWSMVCICLAVGVAMLALLHFLRLPHLSERIIKANPWRTSVLLIPNELRQHLLQPHFIYKILFLLLFLLPEGFFFRIGILFLIDPGSNGGLSLSPQELGFIQGSVGGIALIIGGLLGAHAIRRQGFKYWIWPMTVALTLPKIFYVFMSYTLTTSITLITLSVFLEQLGFGIGAITFVAFLVRLYKGHHSLMLFTYGSSLAVFAIMLIGAFAGYVQDYMGYRHFFVLLLCINALPFSVVAFILFHPSFSYLRKD